MSERNFRDGPRIEDARVDDVHRSAGDAKHAVTNQRATNEVLRHRSVIAIDHDADQSATVTLAPTTEGGALGTGWFRLFRDLVRGGTWAQLGNGARSVLVVLCESVNDAIRREQGEWLAWPSVPTIAKRAGLAERNVYVALKELEAKKLISKLAQGGGRRQTTYAVKPPVVVNADQFPPLTQASGVTDSTGMMGTSGVTGATRLPGRPRQASPVRAVMQQRESILRENDSSKENGVDGDLEGELKKAGITPKVIARLLKEHESRHIELHLMDWQTRRESGQRLGVAWLLAAIRDDYAPAQKTLARIDGEKGRLLRVRNDEDERTKQKQEEARIEEIERRAIARFDELSDAELCAWRERVVEEMPVLLRDARSADPRTHVRLRRMILAKLGHEVSGLLEVES